LFESLYGKEAFDHRNSDQNKSRKLPSEGMKECAR